jgi:hypothetical protein
MSLNLEKKFASMLKSAEQSLQHITEQQLERVKSRTYDGVGADGQQFRGYADERAGRSRPKVAGPTLFDQVRVDVRSSFDGVRAYGDTNDTTAGIILLWQNDRRPFLARTSEDELAIRQELLQALARGYNAT